MKEELNYKKLGFKCGIEAHQQIEGSKLFCRCPANVHGGTPNTKVIRRLRASAGETGEVDIAAKHEMKKGKVIEYIGDSNNTCLVELDDDPPKETNKQALDVALQASLLMNAKIVDEIQVMRKTVVDGSNTSGFQRTMLIATDGYIETSKGKVCIPIILLEEEAAQKVKETKDTITYNLDRLGVALIEIATDASIKDPDHAKEVAEMIGMICRSTGKAKRGIGTIRQDINVSIKGHPRIEIKGFQDIKVIKKTIENEVKRQLKAIKSKKKLESHVRDVKKEGTSVYQRPMPGADRMYPETDIAPFKPDIAHIKLPELISEKADKLKEIGLGKDLANLIAKQGKTELFLDFASKFKKIKPSFIAETMLPTIKELSRHGLKTENIKDSELENIFNQLNKSTIAKDSVIGILKQLCKGHGFKTIIKKFKLISDKELEKELKTILSKNKDAPFGALMGIAMSKLRGRADGKKISGILKRLKK